VSTVSGASAIVQEATCSARLVVLKVRIPGADESIPKTSLVIVGAPRNGVPAVGLLTSDERRAAWRGRLPGGIPRERAREDALAHAHVVALGPSEVFIDQHGLARVVRAERDRVVVTDEPLPAGISAFVDLTTDERAALAERGRALAEAFAASAIDARRTDVARVLEKALQRIRRRHDAIRGDLAKIDEAERIAGQAQWLIGEAARAPRGATKLVVTDWSTGESVPLEIPLDPSKSAKDQVAAMFKRAKRLRLGGRVAVERLERTAKQLAEVEAEARGVAMAQTLGELEETLLRAKRAAPRDVTLLSPTTAPSGRAKAAGGANPYRTFLARSGRTILVGKGAASNDTLTLRVGRPHDLWLHAKERTGAHVIVVLDRGHSCPAEDLVDAAHLAAHFSDARDEAVVDVQYTQRRYLRKPKGSPPGFVVVDREKVLVLRVDPGAVRELLEREEL
jgi:predicted ribosome quality control (RQC) complex YloA/Tae2 family protein